MCPRAPRFYPNPPPLTRRERNYPLSTLPDNHPPWRYSLVLKAKIPSSLNSGQTRFGISRCEPPSTWLASSQSSRMASLRGTRSSPLACRGNSQICEQLPHQRSRPMKVHFVALQPAKRQQFSRTTARCYFLRERSIGEGVQERAECADDHHQKQVGLRICDDRFPNSCLTAVRSVCIFNTLYIAFIYRRLMIR